MTRGGTALAGRKGEREVVHQQDEAMREMPPGPERMREREHERFALQAEDVGATSPAGTERGGPGRAGHGHGRYLIQVSRLGRPRAGVQGSRQGTSSGELPVQQLSKTVSAQIAESMSSSFDSSLDSKAPALGRATHLHDGVQCP